MAKRRVPDTVEHALDQAIGFAGIDCVAQWIGKSENAVRKFSDPDKVHQLQLCQALEIDRHLALAGFPQPFAELIAARAEGNRRSGEQLVHALSEARPLHEAAAAVCLASRLVADIEKAEADGVYSPAEIDKLDREVMGLQKRLPALKRAIAARRGRK